MIVARGLGRGAGAVLVTAGLGLAASVSPPPAVALPTFVTDDAVVSQLWLTDEQIRRQNDLILLTVMSAVTGGMLG